ncbi:unnamed protein product [Medioppia subpectinata]|uniref:Thymosin beta n=1 Tax=Medioppia subpectinata TaxID=1979941 RepID=A0A7R9PVH3_9ACAR|nr:unnamed protein product [Medioppia subpectinata]CAG2101802.1 unnamed protein product [Medioppia subpectinata]
MSSPKDLPKPLTNPLAAELTAEHQLKKTQTEEKVVLPSAEEIASEKSQQRLFQSIEAFDEKCLKKQETVEKQVLPTAEDIKAEKPLI